MRTLFFPRVITPGPIKGYFCGPFPTGVVFSGCRISLTDCAIVAPRALPPSTIFSPCVWAGLYCVAFFPNPGPLHYLVSMLLDSDVEIFFFISPRVSIGALFYCAPPYRNTVRPCEPRPFFLSPARHLNHVWEFLTLFPLFTSCFAATVFAGTLCERTSTLNSPSDGPPAFQARMTNTVNARFSCCPTPTSLAPRLYYWSSP